MTGTPPPGTGGPSPSSREKMRDAVDQLMQQVKDQKEQSRAEVQAEKQRLAQRRQIRWLQAAVLTLTFIIALMYAIPHWQHPLSAPTGAKAVHDARRAVIFASQLIEHRIRTTGQLPITFEELGVPIAGIGYHRIDSQAYTVSITVEGRTLQYRRGDDANVFLAQP